MALNTQVALKVVIVGCGLGGLACAIACRREGLDVVILERADELVEAGAGIQLPPMAMRIMDSFGLIPELYDHGLQDHVNCRLLRWEDGSLIGIQPDEGWAEQKFGYSGHTIHRADYQRVLAAEASRLGARLCLGSTVSRVDCSDISPTAHLENGGEVRGDVVIGADGLHSNTRTSVLGYTKKAKESGDLAYRVTIPVDSLRDERDSFIQGLIKGDYRATYWGPDSHVVIYCVKGGKLLNMVAVRPDDLPAEAARQPGDLAEMRKMFETWDPRLQRLLEKVANALKWKIWTMDPLETWVKGSVTLLGDACHPTVPYAAAGAAMAVEDGAVMGRLLGLFTGSSYPRDKLPRLMQYYEELRKDRTTMVVATADGNRDLYHMHDGTEQQRRDIFFQNHDWWDEERRSAYKFADLTFLHGFLGFDAVKDAGERFAKFQGLN